MSGNTHAERSVEVADGVIAFRYEHLDQTLGLVLGDERCLVIDTGGDEVQGAALASAVRRVTALPWTVVITHAHFDHYFGTNAFLPCPVWAHERCWPAMRRDAERDRAEWAARLRHENEPDVADALTAATLVPPTEVVGRRTELDLGERAVTLLHPGRGHTDHDLLVQVPDAGVVFAGDLVEQGAPPSVGADAHPAEWPRALDVLLALRPATVVPGHGEPVDTAFVAAQRNELAGQRW